MAYIAQVAEGEATGLLGQIYQAARQREGVVANIVKVMSQDERSLQAAMQFYMTVIKGPGPLDTARREMLAAVVSNVNDCYY